MRIVFWLNTQSPHVSSYLRALANREDCDITLVTQVSGWRKNIGCSAPDYGDVKLVFSPYNSEINEIIEEDEQNSIHIFGGIKSYPMVKDAFIKAITTKARVGIISESGDWRGLKGKARLLRGRLDAFRYQSRISFILAIGHLGVKWFKMCGYPEDKIYPWIYTIEKPPHLDNSSDLQENRSSEAVELIFIGQLIRRKGVDILLRALSGLNNLDWHLQLVGDGVDRTKLEKLSDNLGLSERVHFEGALRNEEAVKMLFQSDLFILPSRWDGWGAVVNEALMRGVPVVCSSNCGSADLLKDPERGEVFLSGSVSALRDVLSKRIRTGKLNNETASRIRQWSTAIEGVTVAKYLLEVIDAANGHNPKPMPPWQYS